LCLAVTSLVVSALLFPTAASAAQAVDTQIMRVALFKNGLGFFIRQGELPAQPGVVRIGPLPAATHGTLWLSYAAGVKFSNLAAQEEAVVEWRDALTLPELLQANLDKRVRLEFASEFRSSLEGVLKSYPRESEPPEVSPYMAVGRSQVRRPQAELLLIETDRGIVAIKPSTVDRIVFLEEPVDQFPEEIKHLALEGELTQTTAEQTIAVSYLAKGITWAPSYVVDISQPEEALLSAKAVILNEIEDLEEVQVDLVTGFPYLEFGDIITPLAKKEDLSAFLNALSRGASEGRQRREYAAVTQQVMWNVAEFAGAPPTPDYGTAAAGIVAEDLFLYPLEDVTLKKDEVGYYPLFTERIAYEHVYEWDIPDYVNESGYYERPREEQRQIVWHSLRLKNSTRVPWTTAPAETVQEGHILGQAMMHYTPAGGDTMLKITQALGIQAEETELETDREVGALTVHGYSYDRVTVEGTLRLRNFKDEAVTVKITKLVTGEVAASSPEAEVEKLAKGLRQVNPRSRLTWEISLDPGQEREVTYVYKVFIRR